MIDIMGFSVGVRLNDEGPGFHHHGKLVRLFHFHYFRMSLVPGLVQAVNQKIGSFIGQLYPREYLEADSLPLLKGIFKIGKIIVNLFLVREAFTIRVDIPIQEMIGEEDAVIADGVIEVNRVPGGCSAAEADGRCVAVGLISEKHSVSSFPAAFASQPAFASLIPACSAAA